MGVDFYSLTLQQKYCSKCSSHFLRISLIEHRYHHAHHLRPHTLIQLVAELVEPGHNHHHQQVVNQEAEELRTIF